MGTYADQHRRSLEDREAYWMEQAATVSWEQPPTRALDDGDAPMYRWYPDGVLNTCHNALDRHLPERADQLALVHDSAYTGEVTRWTYADLTDRVARLAGGLASLGVSRGDRVVIYMPMVPEAVMAMLACARIGAIHSVVFGGFAAKELATRIEDAQPVAVISASCGIEPGRVVSYKPLLDEAIAMVPEARRPRASVVLQRPQETAPMGERDTDMDELIARSEPVGCTPVAATDPLYVLYTSGTTGRPKGVVRDNGGHAVAMATSMRDAYGMQPGEVFWAASDVGWVVGHSYIVYGPLIAGCTTVMFEGKPVGTPDAGAFWRVIADHGVDVLFTAPTAMRAIKRVDPDATALRGVDLGGFRTLFLAGERCDPDTLTWCADTLDVPVIDHWWQTETGHPISCNPMGVEPLPVKPGSATVPMPGWDVRILDDAGEEVEAEEIGNVVVRLPLPPGALPTLWNDDERFLSSYLSRFDGYYLTGDAGMIDADGYLSIMSRIDDIINVAGHRLSTGAMEEVLAGHPAVAECAVIGVADALKGEVPMGLVVLKAGVTTPADVVTAELVQRVRDQIGPVAAFKRALVVDGLPKTRSGKVLRRTAKAIAEGRDYAVPSTIEDPDVLDRLGKAIAPDTSAD